MSRRKKTLLLAGLIILPIMLIGWIAIQTSTRSLPQAQKIQATLAPSPGSYITSMVWNASGDLLAFGDSLGVVRVVRLSLHSSDVTSSSFVPVTSIKADSEVYSLSWSPKDDLAIGYDNGNIKTFDLERNEVTHQLKARQGWISSLVWSANGEQLTVSSDGETRIWYLPTERLLISVPVEFGQVHWKKDHHLLAGSNAHRNTEIWDIGRSQLETTINAGMRSRLSPDGKELAGDRGSVVTVWDVEESSTPKGFQGIGHGAGLTYLAWSTDSTRIATASGILGNDFSVKIWRLSDMSLYCTMNGHTDDPVYLEWFADNTRLVSLSFDQTVRIWNSDTCELIEGFYAPGMDSYGGALNLPMKIIAATNRNEVLEFWYLSSSPNKN